MWRSLTYMCITSQNNIRRYIYGVDSIHLTTYNLTISLSQSSLNSWQLQRWLTIGLLPIIQRFISLQTSLMAWYAYTYRLWRNMPRLTIFDVICSHKLFMAWYGYTHCLWPLKTNVQAEWFYDKKTCSPLLHGQTITKLYHKPHNIIDGFVVFMFIIVCSGFVWFIQLHFQGCFTGTETIIWMLQHQSWHSMVYGPMLTKHSESKKSQYSINLWPISQATVGYFVLFR